MQASWIASLLTLAIAITIAHPAAAQEAQPMPPLPVRGFHTLMPGYWGNDGRPQIARFEKFITDVLAPKGINVLVVEVGYNYQYHSVPKIGNPNAVGPDDVKRLLAACRRYNIKLIPQLNCLGHQATGKGSLLGEYPDYREKPGNYPSFLKDPMPKQTEGASYCPQHPAVHDAVFALLDELGDAFEADTIHVGMDEVMAIASSNCPRCAEKDPAVLFADEVTRLHDHLASKGRRMWMWGDRFILASEHGFVDWGWASSRNYTYPAIDKVPKDIVICDWHYDNAPPTPRYFVSKGFPTIACPCMNEQVALQQLLMMRQMMADPDPQKAGRSLGVMLTTWVEVQDVITAYEGHVPPLDGLPKWSVEGWKAAAGSAKMLSAMAGNWNRPATQLASMIHEAKLAPALAWSGEAPIVGNGWAGPAGSASTITVKPGAGREKRAAIEFHADAKGWTGCLWNWHGWSAPDAATDTRDCSHLHFWARAAGDKPQSLDISLGSPNDQHSTPVNLLTYSPQLWDGEWHEVLIPLADLETPKTNYDPSHTRELVINTSSPDRKTFTLLVGEIGFIRKP